jgi:hypothetical protein
MTNEEKSEILLNGLGAYPVGYFPDGPLQRGALYQIENKGIRMYPPDTLVYQKKKARRRWEAERIKIYEEHKFEWLDLLISETRLPEINDELKFNHYPPSYSGNTQAILWVFNNFRRDQDIENKVKKDWGDNMVLYVFHTMSRRITRYL